jgi:hypothetical protein
MNSVYSIPPVFLFGKRLNLDKLLRTALSEFDQRVHKKCIYVVRRRWQAIERISIRVIFVFLFLEDGLFYSLAVEGVSDEDFPFI